MSKIESIERDIEALDDKGFAAFRAWFIEYENARWDRQIEADANSGASTSGTSSGEDQAALKHLASPAFWSSYHALPEDVR